jgi:Protein of unknown function (DUF2933)
MSTDDHTRGDESPSGRFLTFTSGLVLIGFLAIAGVYLWMEHRAHLLGALVWLPLLLCPLMHFFMGARMPAGSGLFVLNWENLRLRKTAWWGWEDSNFQPNDYQLLASGAAYEALSPQIAD